MNAQPARIAMFATYVVGGIGLMIGFVTVTHSPRELSLGCLLAVGAVGVLSFIRHGLLHRSDAARMGWDYGTRNNFQIEVGIANLAWGIVAILAVALGWGLAVESALLLTFGVYMAGVAAFKLFAPDEGGLNVGAVIGAISFGGAMLYLGILGMSAAT